MELQNNDIFKILEGNANGSGDQLLLQFTKRSGCSSDPKSCGQVLGRFDSTPVAYTFAFEGSGGKPAALYSPRPIQVDITVIYQSSCKTLV